MDKLRDMINPNLCGDNVLRNGLLITLAILLVGGLNFLMIGMPFGYYIMNHNSTFCSDNLIVCAPIYFFGVTGFVMEICLCIYVVFYCSKTKCDEENINTYGSTGEYVTSLQMELNNLDD